MNPENFDFTYSALKLKYWNDCFWIEFSRFTLPVLLAVYIYKIFKPINYSLYKTYSEIPNFKQDRILRWFIFYAPFYYVLDTILIILSGLGGECCK